MASSVSGNQPIRVWLINCDNLRQIRLGKRYLKVQGPSTRRETEQQRTRRIFVVGIVVDQLSSCARLPDFPVR